MDVSAESLQACRGRVDTKRVTYQQQDFRNLDYAPQSFDLVASSIAVHHLTADEEQSLFGNIYRWLRPGGVFAYGDQHAGATADLYQRHIANWHRISKQAGSSEQEWDMWMQHQRQHDHHDTLGDQMGWLREAGFSIVDCPWRYLLWTVLLAIK